jgi:hypothetical protein
VGTHQVTASVTDSGSLVGSESITVTVQPVSGNTAPVVDITSPTNGSSYVVADPILFAATADDAEEGDLSGGLIWVSDVDGQFATGASASVTTLSVGTHQVTASVTDTAGTGLTGSDTVTVVVTSGGGVTPTCGAPSYDSATEAGAYLWQDCGGDWKYRVTAGGLGFTYEGELVSEGAATLDVVPFSFEGNDVPPPNYVMNVGGRFQDGLNFSFSGGTVCLTVTQPSGMTIIAGSNNVDVGNAVRLPDFGPCL